MAKKKEKKEIVMHKSDEELNTEAFIADKMLRLELLNARKAKHISQKELSELSGLSVSCISNIETGEQSSPTLRSLIKYTSGLGISLSVIYAKSENFDTPEYIVKEV